MLKDFLNIMGLNTATSIAVIFSSIELKKSSQIILPKKILMVIY